MAIPSTSQILRDAADILARNGRARNDFYDHDQAFIEALPPSKCRVCAYGAISLAAGADLEQADFEEPSTVEERAAIEAAEILAVHLGLIDLEDDPSLEEVAGLLISAIGRWNDYGATSDEQVLAALRTAADRADSVRDGGR